MCVRSDASAHTAYADPAQTVGIAAFGIPSAGAHVKFMADIMEFTVELHIFAIISA